MHKYHTFTIKQNIFQSIFQTWNFSQRTDNELLLK